jgi:DNA replication protein DnaC
MGAPGAVREASDEREGRDCETCGRAFSARVIRCLGAKIVARHCGPCVERHEAEEERRRAAERAARRRPSESERWAALCPPEFRTIAEGGRTDEARLQRECALLARVLAWRYGERGLILQGTTGRCKTRALWRLLRRLFGEGRQIVVLTAGELGRSYADAAGRYESSAWFERMTTVDVLCVDDLGKGCWSEAVRAAFFDVVDKRMRHGLPLLVTTNDDGAQIAERMRDVNLGDPLVRRLREFCEVVGF